MLLRLSIHMVASIRCAFCTFENHNNLRGRLFLQFTMNDDVAGGVGPQQAIIVWIKGPYQGGQSDINMLRHGGLLDKIVDGTKALVPSDLDSFQKVIADQGYHHMDQGNTDGLTDEP